MELNKMADDMLLVYEDVNEFKKPKKSSFKSMINLKELDSQTMEELFTDME